MLNFKKNNKKLIIAEIGQGHKNSIKEAKKLIDLTARSGADIIKFQTHYADAESTYDEKFRKGFNFKHKTRFDYWKSCEFTKNEWRELKRYSNKKKLIFTSSPFSEKAFFVLKSIGVNIWKIGSGEFYSEELINLICKTKDPIILSTGLSNWKEITKKVNLFKKLKKNFVLLQCTTQYPLPLKDVGMNIVYEMKERFDCPVGLSDHSGSIFPSLLALSDNTTQIIEAHVAKKNNKTNPDNSSSISFDQLAFICNYRDKLEILKNSKVNKDLVSQKLLSTRKLFTKSLALKKDLKKGKILKKENLSFKKPGSGLGRSEIKKILGKKAKQNISKNQLLKRSFFE
jgi:N,N'-diacetyllegionaminate synthase